MGNDDHSSQGHCKVFILLLLRRPCYLLRFVLMCAPAHVMLGLTSVVNVLRVESVRGRLSPFLSRVILSLNEVTVNLWFMWHTKDVTCCQKSEEQHPSWILLLRRLLPESTVLLMGWVWLSMKQSRTVQLWRNLKNVVTVKWISSMRGIAFLLEIKRYEIIWWILRKFAKTGQNM